MRGPQMMNVKKTCPICQRQFGRWRRDGRLEHLTNFRRRIYCDRSCGNSKLQRGRQAWLWRSRRHRKDACEACGYGRYLHVHHIDQNIENDDPGNLQTLCTHCHNFFHATAERLGLPIAGRMVSLGLPRERRIGLVG